MLDRILLALWMVGVALSRTVAPRATSYDYIIVGAGPTGIVTADRLSEKGKSVLLIERGGPSTAETGGSDVPPWAKETHLTRFDIPGVSESVYFGTNQYWWCNDIVPRAACLVGGGSAINGILYWYPTDSEYSKSNGWPRGWQSVSQYLNKFKARLPSTDNPSKDGKRYLTEVYYVVKSILRKQGYNGLTANDNRNKKNRVYSHTAYHIQNAKRAGPMDTYLKTARARPNFTLLTGTKVLSVLRKGDQITGVQTDNFSIGNNGVFNVTTVKGRVVLAAGAFGTARLLFQSGIGPSDMLSIAAANSSVSQYMPPPSQYIDLPVGMNVQDNPAVRAVFTHPHIDSYNNWADVYANPRPADAAQYISNRSGVLAAPSARVNFWKVYDGPDGRKRNTQTTCRPSAAAPFNVSNVFTCTMYLSKGLTSLGRIGIDSAMRGILLKDPWFVDPADKTTLESAFSDFLSTYKQVHDLQLISPNSTTSIPAHMATFTGSNHWVGSTRIGTNSSTSVVDPNTKVWNTKNLFIVDAGIFPGMTVANPVGALLVMAEMASAKILALSGGS